MLAVTPRPQSMMIDRPAIAKCDDVGKKDAPSPRSDGPPLVPSKTSFAMFPALFLLPSNRFYTNRFCPKPAIGILQQIDQIANGLVEADTISSRNKVELTVRWDSQATNTPLDKARDLAAKIRVALLTPKQTKLNGRFCRLPR